MPLKPGERLGSYEITAAIGAGGMGEVYRARDVKLRREIAVKVLPDELARDRERLARFEREAQALASLNHPNIVTIYSVEKENDLHFITLELVQGKPLSELIPGHGFRLEDFFKLAVPMIDAVGAAHLQGITHRDLKPDNIMVTPDRRVKILDFGLAKVSEPAASAQGGTGLPTATVTQQGRIMGTIAYMAPEQAEGKPVDHRSDIFSAGVVLYQMATGQRPFKGETGASLLSSILRDTPSPVTDLNSSLPRHLERIIAGCLKKDPDLRYQSARDLRNQLEDLAHEVESGRLEEAGAMRAPAGRLAAAAVPAVASALLVLLILFGYQRLGRKGDPVTGPAPRPLQATFSQLTAAPGAEIFPSLSPDGKSVVYAARDSGDWDIFSLRVGGQNPVNLTEAFAVDDTQPAYSQDGEMIAFRSERGGGGIFVMGATGESPRRLTDFGYNPAWSPDGQMVLFATERIIHPFGRGTSYLWTAHLRTGVTTQITQSDGVQPSWSPNGRRIAFWRVQDGGQRDILTIPAEGGDPLPVTDDAATDWNPVWAPDGEYLYFASDRAGAMNLWRVRIDQSTGEVLDRAEAITSGVAGWSQHLSLSGDGKRIVFDAMVNTTNIQRVPFDPATGSIAGEPSAVTSGSSPVQNPQVSPDGRLLVMTSPGVQEDIILLGTDGSNRLHLTNDLFKDRTPAWSPRGDRIAFYSDRSGNYEIWTIRPDGSGLEPITRLGSDVWFPVWSPDGSRIACFDGNESQAVILDLGVPLERREPQVLPLYEDDRGGRFQPRSWSPDGKKLAGQINLRRDNITAGITIYDLATERYTALTDVGRNPAWLADGRRLLFTDDSRLKLLDTATGDHEEIFSVSPYEINSVTIAPDQTGIYYELSSREADVWLLEVR